MGIYEFDYCLGDNVTIKGLTVQPKVEENKSIEISHQIQW